MTDNDSDTVEWSGQYRMHYLTIAVISFGIAAVMLDLNLAEAYTTIGAAGVFAWFGDIIAEAYFAHKHR